MSNGVKMATHTGQTDSDNANVYEARMRINPNRVGVSLWRVSSGFGYSAEADVTGVFISGSVALPNIDLGLGGRSPSDFVNLPGVGIPGIPFTGPSLQDTMESAIESAVPGGAITGSTSSGSASLPSIVIPVSEGQESNLRQELNNAVINVDIELDWNDNPIGAPTTEQIRLGPIPLSDFIGVEVVDSEDIEPPSPDCSELPVSEAERVAEELRGFEESISNIESRVSEISSNKSDLEQEAGGDLINNPEQLLGGGGFDLNSLTQRLNTDLSNLQELRDEAQNISSNLQEGKNRYADLLSNIREQNEECVGNLPSASDFPSRADVPLSRIESLVSELQGILDSLGEVGAGPGLPGIDCASEHPEIESGINELDAAVVNNNLESFLGRGLGNITNPMEISQVQELESQINSISDNCASQFRSRLSSIKSDIRSQLGGGGDGGFDGGGGFDGDFGGGGGFDGDFGGGGGFDGGGFDEGGGFDGDKGGDTGTTEPPEINIDIPERPQRQVRRDRRISDLTELIGFSVLGQQLERADPSNVLNRINRGGGDGGGESGIVPGVPSDIRRNVRSYTDTANTFINSSNRTAERKQEIIDTGVELKETIRESMSASRSRDSLIGLVDDNLNEVRSTLTEQDTGEVSPSTLPQTAESEERLGSGWVLWIDRGGSDRQGRVGTLPVRYYVRRITGLGVIQYLDSNGDVIREPSAFNSEESARDAFEAWNGQNDGGGGQNGDGSGGETESPTDRVEELRDEISGGDIQYDEVIDRAKEIREEIVSSLENEGGNLGSRAIQEFNALRGGIFRNYVATGSIPISSFRQDISSIDPSEFGLSGGGSLIPIRREINTIRQQIADIESTPDNQVSTTEVTNLVARMNSLEDVVIDETDGTSARGRQISETVDTLKDNVDRVSDRYGTSFTPGGDNSFFHNRADHYEDELESRL